MIRRNRAASHPFPPHREATRVEARRHSSSSYRVFDLREDALLSDRRDHSTLVQQPQHRRVDSSESHLDITLALVLRQALE